MLAVHGLGFRHGPSRPWLFRALSFDLEAGRILALLGPNGRGKTSLLKCLAGLLAPVEGRVSLAGAPAYVPQQFATPFAYKVRDVVIMGRARHIGLFAGPTRHDRAVADAALARLGLSNFAERSIATLSGGERQMVLVARSLASGAGVMLLDEPTASLDFRNQAILLGTLRAIADERGMAIVMTSHDPAHALEIADRVLLLHDAGRHEEGTAAAVLTEAGLGRLYGIAMRRVRADDGSDRGMVPDYKAIATAATSTGTLSSPSSP